MTAGLSQNLVCFTFDVTTTNKKYDCNPITVADKPWPATTNLKAVESYVKPFLVRLKCHLQTVDYTNRAAEKISGKNIETRATPLQS